MDDIRDTYHSSVRCDGVGHDEILVLIGHDLGKLERRG
jgi:hypothetical protein